MEQGYYSYDDDGNKIDHTIPNGLGHYTDPWENRFSLDWCLDNTDTVRLGDDGVIYFVGF